MLLNINIYEFETLLRRFRSTSNRDRTVETKSNPGVLLTLSIIRSVHCILYAFLEKIAANIHQFPGNVVN